MTSWLGVKKNSGLQDHQQQLKVKSVTKLGKIVVFDMFDYICAKDVDREKIVLYRMANSS